MPELPEVETIVRTLRPLMVGSVITQVEILTPSMVKPSPTKFTNAIIHRRLEAIERLGKFIVFFFADDTVVVSHLRMEGKYYELKQATDPLPRFPRMILTLDDGRRIIYDDMRKFGTFTVTSRQLYRQLPALAKLGIEPMNVQDSKKIYQQFLKSHRPIKASLLDQTILLGLGNIYADEVLFACKIHPLTPSSQVTPEQTEAIITQSQKILKRAIQLGGTRIRSYHSVGKIDGRFQGQLHVYGQNGKACLQCGHRIDKIVVAGRGTHYCPRCQHHPGFPFVIGITGTIATGKSSLLSLAQTQGFSTIQADQIVHELYQKPQSVKTIQTLFPELKRGKKIDRGHLLTLMVKDLRRYQKLIRWLFPLVKEEIYHRLLKSHSAIVFLEVPLLFQSHLDAYCDWIVGVEMPREKQKKLLQSRQPQTAESLWILNERNHYQAYQSWMDEILVNQGTLAMWQKQIQSWLKKRIQNFIRQSSAAS